MKSAINELRKSKEKGQREGKKGGTLNEHGSSTKKQYIERDSKLLKLLVQQSRDEFSVFHPLHIVTIGIAIHNTRMSSEGVQSLI